MSRPAPLRRGPLGAVRAACVGLALAIAAPAGGVTDVPADRVAGRTDCFVELPMGPRKPAARTRLTVPSKTRRVVLRKMPAECASRPTRVQRVGADRSYGVETPPPTRAPDL
jgi:hypothetical protein